MPDLDYMVVCDYVRAEAGLLHIVAGGVDRLKPDVLPFAARLGVAVRVTFRQDEVGVQHTVALLFKDPGGEVIAEVRGEFDVAPPRDVPEGWPAKANFAPNIVVAVQTAGIHRLELWLDEELKKAIELLVDQVAEA